MRRPYESLSLYEERDSERERTRRAMVGPNHTTTSPVPRTLPAFLKLGQAGPTSTSEMNAAMSRPARARSATPQAGSEW
jgi:hypothetical protein